MNYSKHEESNFESSHFCIHYSEKHSHYAMFGFTLLRFFTMIVWIEHTRALHN